MARVVGRRRSTASGWWRWRSTAARDTPRIRATRCRPSTWSVEGETRRLIASTALVPMGGWSPAARSSLRAARWPSSARPLSPGDGRSRRPERPQAGSSTTPRQRPGRRPASRPGRRRSPRAGATAVPDPHPVTAAAPRPACAAPTSAVGARAWTRLRQRRWARSDRPTPVPTSSSLLHLLAVLHLQCGVANNRRPGDPSPSRRRGQEDPYRPIAAGSGGPRAHCAPLRHWPGQRRSLHIGIGGGLAAAPSHTTVHPGPYPAVRRIRQSSGPLVEGRARPASGWTGRCSGPGWLRSARGRARWPRSAPRADVARPSCRADRTGSSRSATASRRPHAAVAGSTAQAGARPSGFGRSRSSRADRPARPGDLRPSAEG